MENRIINKKLNFFHHLLHLPQDCLAWEVAQLQAKLSLPGLVEECTTLIKMMELPDPGSCTRFQWKKVVNEEILKKNRNDILKEVESKEYKKLDLEELKLEKFEIKPYFSQLNLLAARTKFALRTKMTKTVKMNFKNDPSNKKSCWKCDDCSHVDSQEHILWCPAYGHLRANKNLDEDKDLTRYFQQVLQLRDG